MFIGSAIMNDFPDPLGFSEQWFALGLITQSQHQALLDEFQKGDDPHPEHYRWRVFYNFMRSHDQLNDDLMRQLYCLGEMDIDQEMGCSIMTTILKRSNCPTDLLIKAAHSDWKHLQKIARERI